MVYKSESLPRAFIPWRGGQPWPKRPLKVEPIPRKNDARFFNLSFQETQIGFLIEVSTFSVPTRGHSLGIPVQRFQIASETSTDGTTSLLQVEARGKESKGREDGFPGGRGTFRLGRI